MNVLAVSTHNQAQSNGGNSSESSVLGFKSVLNSTIPNFTTQGKDPVNTKNASLLEPSMLIALDDAVTLAQQQIKSKAGTLTGSNPGLSKSIQSLNTDGSITPEFIDVVRQLQATSNLDATLANTIKNVGTIVDSFETLTPVTQAKINKAQLSFRMTPNDPRNAAQQGFEAIKTAQSYLGIDDNETAITGSTVSVSQKTSRAIRDQLETLKRKNPDIKVPFDSQIFDARAVNFLQKLQEKQMKSAGVTQDNLKPTLLNLWTNQGLFSRNPSIAETPSSQMRDLGETSSLLSAMSYMVSGGLTNGGIADKPRVDKPWDLQWSNQSSGDQFFNTSVYYVLQSYGQVDISELLQPSSFKFQNENLVEAIQRIRHMATTPEGQKNQALVDMAKQFDHYEKQGMNSKLSQYQVGLIATEIMSIQARKLCIDEKDVNKSIDNGSYTPSLADLKMVNTGMGYPPGAMEKISYDTWKPEQRKFDVFAEVHLGGGLLDYRAAQFTERFGKANNDSIQESIKAKYSHLQIDNDVVNRRLQAPIQRYNSGNIDGKTKLEEGYELKRQSYLNTIGQKLQENACRVPDQKPSSGNGSGSGVTPATAAPPVVNNPQGGGSAGGESKCVADQDPNSGGCALVKPSSEKSLCVADQDPSKGECSKQFGGAVGSGNISADSVISENIESATGEPANSQQPESTCTVDLDDRGQCSNKPAAGVNKP